MASEDRYAKLSNAELTSLADQHRVGSGVAVEAMRRLRTSSEHLSGKLLGLTRTFRFTRLLVILTVVLLVCTAALVSLAVKRP
jgi:hypothetical protein